MMLLTCTLLLGLALLYFSAYNYSKQKRNTLYNTANTAIICINDNLDFITEETTYYEFRDAESRKNLQTEFSNIYKTVGVVVTLCDFDGNVILCGEGELCTHAPGDITDSQLGNLTKNGYDYHADLWEGLFQGTGNYSYSCEMYSPQRQVAGYLICVTPVLPLFEYLSDMFLTFLISTAFMIIAATVIIYFATHSLVRPLHEITTAANKFGGGDFEARVTVNGEDEIAQLASSFNRMADSLAEFENMRRGFVANVSHELRTPMTTIGGYIDGILDHTIPPEKEAHYLSIVSDEVRRLSRLTSSLLDIVRLEEGAVATDIVTMNAWEVILSVMSNCERRISRKNITVPDINDEPRYVLCDKDMLYQVLYNLVDNAIKFTPEGGQISISSSQSSGFVTIMVRNTGTGISPDELGYIFERFYKADKSRGLDRTGTGLGLYITKTLIQKMGGEISVTGEHGNYVEFSVRLRAGVHVDRFTGRAKRERNLMNPVGIDRKPGGLVSRT